jgi:hypothetical protein
MLPLVDTLGLVACRINGILRIMTDCEGCEYRPTLILRVQAHDEIVQRR